MHCQISLPSITGHSLIMTHFAQPKEPESLVQGKMPGGVDISCRFLYPSPILVHGAASLILRRIAYPSRLYLPQTRWLRPNYIAWRWTVFSPSSGFSPPPTYLDFNSRCWTALSLPVSRHLPEHVHPVQKSPHTTCPARRLLHSAVSDLSPPPF